MDAHIGQEWLAPVDRFGKVGSRHHVVPRFVLEKWADRNGRVWAKSKQDQKEGVRNIRDLGITDFYTFLAIDEKLDSSMEELLCIIEGRASTVLDYLNNPFVAQTQLAPEDYQYLVTFVAFQMTRSPRRRREHELMADWYGKTMAPGLLSKKIAEADLAALEFVPHQNEHIQNIGPTSEAIAKNLIGRPMCLITIDRPLFLIGDEAVIVNTGGDHVRHHPDCAKSDDEFEQELVRARRKKRKRRKDIRRVVHMYPTQPRGVHQAIEILMPVSPRTLLLFGPPMEWDGVVERDRVTGLEADNLARKVNASIVEYSLDMIVGRIDDEAFQALQIPARTPLLTVCGATGAARAAVNSVPERLRPRRLDRDAGRPS